MVFVRSSSVLVLLGIGFPKRVLGRNTFGGKCVSLFFYCFPRRFPSLIPHVPIAISGVMFVRGSSMGAGVPCW